MNKTHDSALFLAPLTPRHRSGPSPAGGSLLGEPYARLRYQVKRRGLLSAHWSGPHRGLLRDLRISRFKTVVRSILFTFTMTIRETKNCLKVSRVRQTASSSVSLWELSSVMLTTIPTAIIRSTGG